MRLRVMRFLLLSFLFFSLTVSAQQNVQIKGKVVTESGDPLPGASVYVDNSTIGEKTGIQGVVDNYNIGAIADEQGQFTLSVSDKISSLTCSFIGYDTQKIDIVNKNFVLIKMKESDSKMLDNVVVTGYQKIEKRKLTSSIFTIKVKDILQAGVPSVDMMLSGQVPGLQATTLGGAPGSPVKIRIRGTASLNGTQDPLWVLDGIPLEGTDLPDMSGENIDQLFTSSIAGINPSDIADITILKDAAATAIYGARAANGVIIITTKKGKIGKPLVQLNTNLSFTERPDMNKLNLMNSSEKIDYELQLAKYPDLSSDNSVTKKGAIGRLFEEYGLWDQYRDGGLKSLPANVLSQIADLRKINTDWGHELYQTAANQDHSLSVSGGSDRASYYFSTGYYDEKGTTIGTSLNRLNFTMKGEYKLFDNFTLGVEMYNSERKQGSYLINTGSMTNPSRYSRVANPYLSVYDDKGNYNYDSDMPLYNGNLIDYNIIEERNNTSNRQKIRSSNTIFSIDWKIIPQLKFTSQFGLQRDNENNQQYGSGNSYFARHERAASQVGDTYFIPIGGVIKNTDVTSSQWNLKSVLEYNATFAHKHELDVLIGNELRRTELQSIFSAGYGFNKETLTTEPVIFPDPSYASTFPLFTKSYVEDAYASFFGTLGYTFDNKYTFFGSARIDGSDLFGVDKKYKYLPLWAISGAWKINNESFLENVKWLSNLKLRLSCGLQGNIDKGTSRYLIGERKTSTILPGNTETSIVTTNLPNDRLRWEKTATHNVGIDAGFLDDRINLSFDAYYRKSTDLIGTKSVALENGIGSVSVNWASMTNKGLEFNISTTNVRTKNFVWSTILNLSKNLNKVDDIEIPENQATPSLKGHSVNSIFAFKTAGLDKDGYIQFQSGNKVVSATDFFGMEDPSGYGDYQSTLTTEQIRNLYTYKGTTDPKVSGGFINNFKYGSFSLNISCSFNIGQWVKREPFYDIIDMDRGLNRSRLMSKVWTPDNTSGIYPRMIGPYTEDGDRLGDYTVFNTGYALANDVFRDLDIWYKKINYIRVNSIRLGYDLPRTILAKVGISALRLNIEARNPIVFASNYSGYFDPETYGNIYAQPVPRSITMGMNITF